MIFKMQRKCIYDPNSDVLFKLFDIDTNIVYKLFDILLEFDENLMIKKNRKKKMQRMLMKINFYSSSQISKIFISLQVV